MIKYYKDFEIGGKKMEEKKVRSWTDEQLSAINNRDKTLLVSAAAGSGKTATLTERIIRSLLDKENPVSISSLLIVTFTRAAASELRMKITKALEEAVRENPDNSELEKQLYLLPSAKIRTIDAFCNDILKINTDRAGISPSYRLLEAAEEGMLAVNILEGMIDALYAGELPEIASAEEFERLSDCLTSGKKNSELTDIFRLIYSKLESEVEGVSALLPLIENLNPDSFESVESSIFGELMLSELGECAEHYLKIYSRYEKEFSDGEGAEEKYLPFIESDKILLKTLEAGSYSEIRNCLLRDKIIIDLTAVRKGKTERMEAFKAVRDEMKAEVSYFVRFFHYTEEQWKDLYSGLYPLLKIFHRFLLRFDRLFFEEKRRRGCFSYADIARLAYNCLVENGRTTEIAESMRAQFSAIYIDEYQDVNPLQNSIFEAISRKDNRFMVGDIKQSIYVFRKAKPEIFAKMKSTFPHISKAVGDEAGIFMSKNFRSDKAILDFVNGIFDKIFTLAGQSIGYEAGDRLTLGKNCDTTPYIKPEICVIDKSSSQLDEPMTVALKIKELISGEHKKNDGTPIVAGDIAILLRFAKDRDMKYALALKKLGIPSVVAAKEDYFLTPEVLLTLSVLNSIDNPRRDVYLAGYMCSPIAGFSADELYLIKKEGAGDCLYESLVSYVDLHSEYKKGRAFLDKLSYYRTIAEGIGVDDLIFRIYHETGLMALAAKNGGKDNLTLLYDHARSFEAGAFKGLYNFIHFINNLSTKKDTEFDSSRDGADVNAVKIMTCHSSKGLEYPVVFLSSAGSLISNKDASDRVVYSDELGLAFRLRTPSGLLPVDNPVREIINMHNTSKMYEEELRILYVALTRARERLYITGASPLKSPEKYIERCFEKRESLDSYSAKNLSSFLEIAIVASEGYCVVDQYEFLGMERMPEELGEETDGEELAARCDAVGCEEEKIDTELLSELRNRFTYSYKDKALTLLPEKMSVSKTSPTVLDGSDEYEFSLVKDTEERDTGRTLPHFAERMPAEESAKRGIATHYLLQFCDLQNLKKNGASAELKRLVDKGFISKKDAERVRCGEIEMFRESKLMQKMLEAKKLYREFRFTTAIPASSLTAEEDKILAYKDRSVLVQGVIDCIVENPDGTLSLYDYKTDRLTSKELSDKSLAEDTLKRKHATQLSYYAMAVKEIFGKVPVNVEVYSLHLGDTVDVSI